MNHAPRTKKKVQPFKSQPTEVLDDMVNEPPIWFEERGKIRVEVYEHARKRNVEPYWLVRVLNRRPDPNGIRTRFVLRENLSTTDQQILHLSELLARAVRVIETRRQVLLEQFLELKRKYEISVRRRAAAKRRWAQKRCNENATKGS